MKTQKNFERNKVKNVEKGEEKNTQTKKPFDKKTYRLKKYSNKYKVDQFEDRRKKAVLRRYYKDIQKDKRNTDKEPKNVNKGSSESEQEESSGGSSSNKINPFYAAKKEYTKKKEEKKKRIEELQRKKEEKIEALNKYREAKALKYKKLSKKTKKGQPVMKDRIEMLLEKIQQTTK